MIDGGGRPAVDLYAGLRGRGAVRAVAYCPDGSVVASAGDDGLVQVWDARTGAPVHTLDGHTHEVWSLAYHPDGSTLASCGADRTVRVWDMRAFTTRLVLAGHTDRLTAVAFSPDGSELASGGTERVTITGHTDEVRSVAFSPDGSALASVCARGGADAVRIWDTNTGAVRLRMPRHGQWAACAVFSPDGSELATAAGDGFDDRLLRIWDTGSGELCRSFTCPVEPELVTYGPDGTSLATAGIDGAVRIWAADTGELRRTLTGPTDTVNALAFSPDGTTVAGVVAYERKVWIWDLRTGEVQLTLHDNERLTQVAYRPDGVELATAGGSEIVIWSAHTGEAQEVLMRAGVTSMAYSPDGSALAAGYDDGVVRIWNPREHRSRTDIQHVKPWKPPAKIGTALERERRVTTGHPEPGRRARMVGVTADVSMPTAASSSFTPHRTATGSFPIGTARTVRCPVTHRAPGSDDLPLRPRARPAVAQAALA